MHLPISELGNFFGYTRVCCNSFFELRKSEKKVSHFKFVTRIFVFAFQSSAVIFCLLAICECVPPYGGGGSDYGGSSYGGSHDEDYHHQEVIKSELILCNDFKIKRSHCWLQQRTEHESEIHTAIVLLSCKNKKK